MSDTLEMRDRFALALVKAAEWSGFDRDSEIRAQQAATVAKVIYELADALVKAREVRP